MARLNDLTGKKFDRLRVIERMENASDGHAQWLCECRCGNRIVITSQSLVCNKTRSCGCYRKETSSIIGHNNKGVRRNDSIGNKPF